MCKFQQLYSSTKFVKKKKKNKRKDKGKESRAVPSPFPPTSAFSEANTELF